MKDGLTAKQEAFVNYYIELGNATEAYKRAGYKVKNDSSAAACAAKLLRIAKIKAAVDAKMEEREKPSIAKADEILSFLSSVVRGEITDQQIVTVGTGYGKTTTVTREVRVSSKERIRAAEQLMKRYPSALDSAEQKARIKRLEADLKAIEDDRGKETDSVVIVDDIGGNE